MKAEATIKYRKNVERYIAIIRLIVILFCAATFYVFYNDVEENRLLILSFTSLSIAYGAYINAFLPFNNLKIRWAIGITYTIDLILMLTWIFLSGGLYSPYWPLLLISIIGFARRFNPKSTALMAGLYCFSFYLVGVYESTITTYSVTPSFFLKIGFILIAAGLVSVYRFEDYSRRKGAYNHSDLLLNRLHAFFVNSDSHYIIIDGNYNIEYLSTVFRTNYEKNFRGKNVVDFIERAYHEPYKRALRLAKESDEQQSLIIESSAEIVQNPQKYEARIQYLNEEKPCYLIEFVPLVLDNIPKPTEQFKNQLEKPFLSPENIEIWILEDNDINIVLFERILKKLGYTNVNSFLNGELALKAIQEQPSKDFSSTIFFIDLEMPIMNGEEFVQTVYPNYPNILQNSVGMTAHIREDIHELFPKTDLIPYWLPKPFNVESVQNCLNQVINGNKA